jgi:hypothetical protein
MAKQNLRPVFGGVGVALAATLAIWGCGGSSGQGRPGATGGSTGTGGSASGTGGSTGAGGSGSGTGGSAGATAAACAANPTTSLLTNFSTAAGDGGICASGTWGTTGQLTGHTFGYGGAMTNDAGVKSSVTATVQTATMDLELHGTVLAADYAGGGMSFDTCVDSTNWTGIQFTLGGTADGCSITFQLQTQSQEPPSNKGTCTASSCYNFPQVPVTITPGTPVVIKFADLAGTGMPAAVADFEKEMFGLQWQFTSVAPPDGGVQVGCSPSMTISDVMWTSN